MGLGLLNVENGAWSKVRINFSKINSNLLGPASTPTFGSVTLTGGLILSDLTASRLAWTNAAKELASKDLIDLVAGTANRVTVVDDAAGGVTLSGPQDIHVDATPEFAGIVIKDAGDNIIFYVDNDELYFTAGEVIPIEAGMPMGLLLAITYAA